MSSAIKEGAYFVPIAGPASIVCAKTIPSFGRRRFRANVIAGQTSLIPTVGIDLVVVCAQDVDEAVVYELTKQLFIAFPRLSGVEAGAPVSERRRGRRRHRFRCIRARRGTFESASYRGDAIRAAVRPARQPMAGRRCLRVSGRARLDWLSRDFPSGNRPPDKWRRGAPTPQ